MLGRSLGWATGGVLVASLVRANTSGVLLRGRWVCPVDAGGGTGGALGGIPTLIQESLSEGSSRLGFVVVQLGAFKELLGVLTGFQQLLWRTRQGYCR